MRKSFTLVETIISLGILSLAITFLSVLGFSYISILNLSKERFLALNYAQEGLELAIALRNKKIETGTGPWSGVSTAGSYCLNFNLTTLLIEANQSSNPCYLDDIYSRIVRYEDFERPGNLNLVNANAVRVTSEVRFKNNVVKLDTILTNWR